MRYLVWSADGRLLAALGFGASAWQVQPRDRHIGWNDRQRRAGLHRIVNNARFLILPWVKCGGLASRILSGIVKPLRADWRLRYGYEPVLLETFVEIPRFTGTSYRAANWIRLGQTQGRGKLEKQHCSNRSAQGYLGLPLTPGLPHDPVCPILNPFPEAGLPKIYVDASTRHSYPMPGHGLRIGTNLSCLSNQVTGSAVEFAMSAS